MTRAREILGNANPLRLDVHTGELTPATAAELVH
jgi:hypothetical protein